MPFKPPIVAYRSAVGAAPQETARPWRRKSAGEIAARICGFGLCCLAVSAPLFAIGEFFGFFGALLLMVAMVAWFVGGVVSVIGVFEAPEARSHVRLGCGMALALTVAYPVVFGVMWLVAATVYARGMGALH